MSEVPSVAAVDNQNLYIQQEPQQMPVEMNTVPGDLGQMPVAYDPEREETRKSAGSMTGLTLLATIALVTAGFFGGRSLGKKGAKDAINELKELKNSDAIKKFPDVQKELEELKNSMAAKNYEKYKQTIEEIDEAVQNRFGAKKKIKNILAKLKNDIEKAAEKAKEAAEKAKKDAEKAKDDAADGAS